MEKDDNKIELTKEEYLKLLENQPTPETHIQQEEIQNDNPKEEIKKDHYFLKYIGALTLIGIIVFFVVIVVLKGVTATSNTANNNSHLPEFFKPAPIIESEQTLTGIVFNINCSYNYDFIIISLELLDKNDSILATRTLRGDNYRKGGTYQIEYKLSFDEQLKTRSIQYSITNYK